MYLRKLYGNSTAARLDARLAAFKALEGRIVLVKTQLPAVPVELFTVVILLAALKVYTDGTPHAQKGLLNTAHVLKELAKFVAAGGQNFGCIQQAHVDAVLITPVPIKELSPAVGGAPQKHQTVQKTSLALILNALPHEYTAMRLAGLTSYLSVLPQSWLMWTAPTIEEVNIVMANGGTFSVLTKDKLRYLTALGTLCRTRYNFDRFAMREDGTCAITYSCYRGGASNARNCDDTNSSDDDESIISGPFEHGDDDTDDASSAGSGADGDAGGGAGGAALDIVGAQAQDVEGTTGGPEDCSGTSSDNSNTGDGAGGAAVAPVGPCFLTNVAEALGGKTKTRLPLLGTNCGAYMFIQMVPLSQFSIMIVSFRGTLHTHTWDSDRLLIGLPPETDRAIFLGRGRGRELSAANVNTNAEAVIARDMIYARDIVVGKPAVKEPVAGIGSSVTSVHVSPGGRVRGRNGHRYSSATTASGIGKS